MVAHTNMPWTAQHAQFFQARGDTVRVVTFHPDRIDGVDSVFVGVEPFDKHANKQMFLTRVPKVRRIVRDFAPDVVFAPYLASNGLTAALCWKGPMVVSAVGGDVLNHARRTGLRKWFRERIIRYVCRRADVVNTVSQALDEELIRLGVPPSKLLRIPFGVDVERFRPDAAVPRTSATRLICTRRHERIYDIPTIIDALARLKAAGRKFHCTFTSDGTLLEEHKARAAAAGLGGCVTFTGDVPFAELPGLLRQADIYVSASLGDGTSVALLEAMASGLLPVVSRIAANEPWVEHGRTGLMFEPGDEDGLANALGVALDDAALRRRAIEENRRRVEQDGDMNRNLARLAEVVEERIAHRERF